MRWEIVTFEKRFGQFGSGFAGLGPDHLGEMHLC
jgi:hypothetical protein